MKKFIFKIMLLGAFVSLFFSCKSSTPLPSAFEQSVAEKNNIGQKKHLVLYSTKTASYPAEVTTGSSAYLFLGKYSGITSWILFRFGFRGMTRPDSAKIRAVNLTLYPSAAAGDSTAEFSATAYLMGSLNPKWDELEMTWSTFKADYLPTPLTPAVNINPLASDSFYFEFDISQFIRPDSTLDSSIIENGFCLRFDTEQNPELLMRFYSCDASNDAVKPTLTIISDFNGEIDTTKDFIGHDAFIVRSEPLPADSSQHLYLGRGISHRSLLQFDFTGIPENATINRAQLRLTLDAENSFFGLEQTPEIFVFPVTNWPDIASNVSIDSSKLGYDSVINEDTLQVELGTQIQKWTSKQESGEGLFLRLTNEGNDIARMVLFSTQADSLLQPKLILDYTIPPSFYD